MEKQKHIELELDNVGHKIVLRATVEDESGKFGKNKNNDDELEDRYRCGIGCFKFAWMQRFASKKVFILIYSILAIIQSMSWAYFSATISTLEKRFKISSKTAGIVMTGNEMSQIIFAIILSHYGGKGHRPRWLAFGTLLASMSCFILSSPHYFYGSGEDALALTEEYHMWKTPSSIVVFPEINDTDFSPTSTPRSSVFVPNVRKNKVELCDVDRKSADGLCHEPESILPLVIIFSSQFVAGIGTILFFSLGGPFIDDNSKKENMPMVFGITSAFRLLGPTLGFLLGAGCLKMYVNPLLTPTIDNTNPNWIGAWWLGWIVLGFMMLSISGIIALFPRQLPSKNGPNISSEEADKLASEEMVKLSDLPKAIKVLLKNKVNMYNNIAGLFYIFSAVGYWTFAPKYLETIFMQSAANASIFSGTVAIGFQAFGLIASGFIISKFKPSARKLAGWNVIVSFLHVAVMIAFTQIGCEVGKLSFGTLDIDPTHSSQWNLTSDCNVDCHCKLNIAPVCHKAEHRVYYSACHAGCTSFDNGTISNCACLPNPEDIVTLGNCAEGCFSIFLIFMGVAALVKLIDSTGRVGNILVAYRCVDTKERSLSIGLGIFLISIFALLPAPILFGAIIDSVCLVWNTSSCKAKENCALYDGPRLRYLFNLTGAAFILVGGLFDCLVWYYVKDLDLYADDTVSAKESAKQESTEKPKEIQNGSIIQTSDNLKA